MPSFLPIIYLSFLDTLLLFITSLIFQEIYKKKNLREQNCVDYYSSGKIYLSKKLFEQAILEFSESLKKLKKNEVILKSKLHNAIGFAYFQTKKLSFAIYHYNEAIKNNPEYIVALNNLGHAYEKKKIIKEAINTYYKVLILDAHNYIATERLNQIQSKLNYRDDRI